MVITIGRECGCSGDEIGEKLSEKLGIPFYSKKKIIKYAKEKGVYDKYPLYFGEMSVDSILNPMSEDFIDKLHKTPEEVLLKLFGNSDCIIIGRASNYAFRESKEAVRVYLCGKKADRISYIAGKHKISEHKARKLVDETDNRRRRYHMYYTGQEWGKACDYDICLDQSRLGVEGVVDIVADYAEKVF